jgi:dephospho-CoA kinase
MGKNKSLVIAVSGKMQHGKDTIGTHLITKYKFKRASFANKVKQICMGYDNSTPTLRKQWNEQVAGEIFPNIIDGATKLDCLMQKIHPGIWRKMTHEECHVTKPENIRLQIQQFAQGCREIFVDCWVNYVLYKCIVEGGRFVITDLRYKNEAFAIEVLNNSQIWRVQRGLNAKVGGNHISEIDLDDYPFEVVIDNNSTIEDLQIRVDKVMKSILRGNRPFAEGEEVY